VKRKPAVKGESKGSSLSSTIRRADSSHDLLSEAAICTFNTVNSEVVRISLTFIGCSTVSNLQ